ncbi:hypothetical protein SAMD00019534_075640 [Acytostelium subglobosum LB1]|uniref:hypothetical protein n=1 Tax=Acytostelium subglobosum LB1 TaxID=1410327 RepID=UPI000644C4D4|nr:hypothetical protein SAMD00019534_075640 [Acytostelium subglobosum LB1]GAM24389.1 hypothetical protein SAMD00019534_075640 [Acytostelium subglobosum LB1]|eukprot:XP_012752715.1 hypothetical protein SAMD00019534_075640 [Acytostelium subglobosum LB1]
MSGIDSNNYFFCKNVSRPCTITHVTTANVRRNDNPNEPPNVIAIKGNTIQIQELVGTTRMNTVDETYLFSTVRDIATLPPLRSTLTVDPAMLSTIDSNNNNNNNNNNLANNKTPHLSLASGGNKTLHSLFKNKDQQSPLLSADKYRLPGRARSRDLILVTSDSGYLSVLGWSDDHKQLVALQQLQIAPPSPSLTIKDTKALGSRIVVSTCGRVVAVAASNNKVSLFPVLRSQNPLYASAVFSKDLREDIEHQGTITTIGFTTSTDINRPHSILCVTFEQKKETFINLYQYSHIDATATCISSQSTQLRPDMFIPLPHSSNKFLIVTRDEHIVMMGIKGDQIQTLVNTTLFKDKAIPTRYDEHSNDIVTSHCWKHDNKQLLLSTEQGHFLKITFTFGDDDANNNNNYIDIDNMDIGTSGHHSIMIEQLKPINQTKYLVDLRRDYILAIGDLDTSVMIQVSADGKITTHFSTENNYAPVVDFSAEPSSMIPDLMQVYMCSSRGNMYGTLSVLENCPAINNYGYVEIDRTSDVWSYPTSLQSKSVLIVVGCDKFAEITRVFTLDDVATIRESTMDYQFRINESTLYSNTISSGYLQVTSSRVRFVSSRDFIDWMPNEEQHGFIVKAISRGNDIIISCSKSLIHLRLNITNRQFELAAQRLYEHDISCLEMANPTVLANCTKEEQAVVSNLFLVGTWHTREIHINRMDATLSTLYKVSDLVSVPHSIKLCRLGDTHIKVVAGFKEGQLLKWEWENINVNPFQSIYAYSKQLSQQHIQLSTTLDDGALVMTNKTYYLTFMKGHPTFKKIAFEDVSCGVINNDTTVTLVQPTVGINLVSIDFSNNTSITPLPTQDLQNPRRLVFIKEFGVLAILYDKEIVLLEPNTKKVIIQKKHELSTPNFLKFWKSKNMVVFGGKGGNEAGIIYFMSISLMDNEIGCLDFKKIPLTDAVHSMHPLEDSYFIMSTSRDTTIVDYNNFSNMESTINIPYLNSVVDITYQHRRILLATPRKGLEVYEYDKKARTCVKKRHQRTPMLTSSCQFMSDDCFAAIDRYGNFTVMAYGDDEQQQGVHTLNTVASYFISESCTKLLKVDNNHLICSGMLGGIYSISRITKREYLILSMLTDILCLFKLTQPLLGNDHAMYRCGLVEMQSIIDGDMVSQFLLLPEEVQLEMIKTMLADSRVTSSTNVVTDINQPLTYTDKVKHMELMAERDRTRALLESLCESFIPTNTTSN